MWRKFRRVGVRVGVFVRRAGRGVPRVAFGQPMLPYVGMGIGEGVIVREPYGVAALISAYNFPFFLNLFKLPPALPPGCTTVLKPSPYTPLETLISGEIAGEAALPPCGLNIVTGAAAAWEALPRHT